MSNKQVLIVSKPFDETSVMQTWMNKNQANDYTIAATDEDAIELLCRMDFDSVIIHNDEEVVHTKKLTAILHMQQPDAVVVNYDGGDLAKMEADVKAAADAKRRERRSRIMIADTLSPANLASQINVYEALN